MPWWALGASGMASNLDVSGTMIIGGPYLCFRSAGFFHRDTRWCCTNISFFHDFFMGKWNRRADVMTTAEWMEFRFGKEVEQGGSSYFSRYCTIDICYLGNHLLYSRRWYFPLRNTRNLSGPSSDSYDFTMCLLCSFEWIVWSCIYRGFPRWSYSICNYLRGISCDHEY